MERTITVQRNVHINVPHAIKAGNLVTLHQFAERNPLRVNQVCSGWREAQDTDVEAYLGTMMTVGHDLVKPIIIDVKMNGQSLKMEVYTGAALSIVSEKVWMTVGQLQTSRVVLRTYNQTKLMVLEEAKVLVEYGNQFHNLMIRVLKEDGPSLVARDWLKHLQLDWKMVYNVQHSVEHDSVWQSVLSKYSNVFKPGLRMMKEITAKLKLKPSAVPQFHRARSVPFSLKWAAPIVVVPKNDGYVRLCADYKVTVNNVFGCGPVPSAQA